MKIDIQKQKEGIIKTHYFQNTLIAFVKLQLFLLQLLNKFETGEH